MCIFSTLSFVLSLPPTTLNYLMYNFHSSLQGRLHFHPVAYGGPAELYPVQFPLGRPTADNLQAICLNGDRRPRYPKSYFPSSGFGSQARRGSSVNKAEAWFNTCCKGNQTWGTEVTLCCLTRAVSFHNSSCSWFISVVLCKCKIAE